MMLNPGQILYNVWPLSSNDFFFQEQVVGKTLFTAFIGRCFAALMWDSDKICSRGKTFNLCLTCSLILFQIIDFLKLNHISCLISVFLC